MSAALLYKKWWFRIFAVPAQSSRKDQLSRRHGKECKIHRLARLIYEELNHISGLNYEENFVDGLPLGMLCGLMN